MRKIVPLLLLTVVLATHDENFVFDLAGVVESTKAHDFHVHTKETSDHISSDHHHERECISQNPLNPHTKFLMYIPFYGKLHNQIMAFYRAVAMAKASNRILIISPLYGDNWMQSSHYAHIPFDHVFDISSLKCVVDAMTWEEAETLVVPSWEHIFLIQTKGLDAQAAQFFQFENVTVPIQLLRTGRDINLRKDNIREVLGNIDEERVLCIGPMFPGGYNPDESEMHWVYQHIKYRREILLEAEEFIKKNLKRPFAAIHVRGWEVPDCKNWVDTKEEECFPQPQALVEAVKRARKLVHHESVFMASDGNRQDLDNALVANWNAKTYSGPLSNGKGFHVIISAIIDSAICFLSDIFIANPYSTMSLHLVKMRSTINATSTYIYERHDPKLQRPFNEDWKIPA